MKSILPGIAIMILLVGCSDEPKNSNFDDIPGYKSISDSIRKNSGDAALYYRRGQLLKKQGHWVPALADFRMAWNMDKKEEYAVETGDLLMEKHIDSATVFYQQALKDLPGNLFIQLNLADNYSKTGKNEEALSLLNEISGKYPGQIDARILRANLLQSQGKPDEALRALEEAYSIAPFDVELSYQLAFAYAENKNPKALALSDSLIRMDTSNSHAEPYYFKGVYYANTGSQSEALNQLDISMKKDYYFLDAYLEKGRILFDQKKYQQALDVFKLAATITPSFADAYLWMGKTQEAMGNKQEADLNYQRAYGLDPSLKQKE